MEFQFFVNALIVTVIYFLLFYLVIKAALSASVGKDIQRTNKLLLELLKASGADISNIASKEERLAEINTRLRDLHEKLQRGEITSDQYKLECKNLESKLSQIR